MRKHTLIIPTYNRPGQLRRLLVSLMRQGTSSRVIVADSSSDENHRVNVDSVGQCGLDVQLLRFDPQIPPFEKFYLAALQVDTEFCSMCADDDFIVVNSVDRIVDYLTENHAVVAAHGWYYSFYENVHVGITSVVYKGCYDDPDPLSRLHAMCASYEAVTYAIYRAPVMRDVLGQVRALPTILSKEFGAGALTILSGKVARLPVMYYGRSLAPSEQYSNWHPLEMLGTCPSALFADYVPYRSVLASRLSSMMDIPLERAETLSDLAHLRYLCDYIKPAVIDYLFECVKRETPKAVMVQNVWPVLHLAGCSPSGYSLWKLLGQKIARRVFPESVRKVLRDGLFRQRTLNAGNDTYQCVTGSGKPREYMIYSAFLQALGASFDPERCCQDIMAALDTYD